MYKSEVQKLGKRGGKKIKQDSVGLQLYLHGGAAATVTSLLLTSLTKIHQQALHQLLTHPTRLHPITIHLKINYDGLLKNSERLHCH